MNGKTARLLRQQLRNHRFPLLTEKQLQEAKPVRVDQALRTAPEIAINHQRRIRGLMVSQQLTIAEAIKRHCRQTGLQLRPKLTQEL